MWNSVSIKGKGFLDSLKKIMCKNRKYWERKKNVGSWRETFWRASLHGNIPCAGQGKYRHIRTLFLEQAHMPMCIENGRDTHERYLLFSDMRTTSFILYLKKKMITTLHRPEDQREVDLCDILQRKEAHTHKTGWSEARMDLSYINQRSVRRYFYCW